MKKISLVALSVSCMFFISCDDKAKEVAESASNSVSEATTKVVDTTKDVATEAKAKAEEMTKATKEKVAEVAEPVVDTVAGVALYAKCAGCHGKDGKIKALGKSPAIAGLSIETLASDLKAYKVGTLNKSGMGSLMKGQMVGMSDSDIDILSAYISSLK